MKRIFRLPPQPIVFTRADPSALAKFDPATKVCTMNCGPHLHDPRSADERKFLCDDCVLDMSPMPKCAPARMDIQQPQIQSENFFSRYQHDGGLALDVYGHFDDGGDFMIEAIGLAGTKVDLSNLIGDDLSDTITGWCEFMGAAHRTSWAILAAPVAI